MVYTSTVTKGEVRTLVRQLLDDPNANFWSNANLDLLIGLVFDSKWSDMLNFNGKLTSYLETISTLNSPGYIDLIADTTKRYYRWQSVTRYGVQFAPTDPRFVTLESNEVQDGPGDSFYVRGDQMWLFPLDLTTDVELRYTYMPTRFDGLATDNTVIEWPQGHELALVYESAALAGAKGTYEDPGTLLAIAEKLTQRMFAAVERSGPMAVGPQTSDEALEWGAVN